MTLTSDNIISTHQSLAAPRSAKSDRQGSGFSGHIRTD